MSQFNIRKNFNSFVFESLGIETETTISNIDGCYCLIPQETYFLSIKINSFIK